MSISFNLIQGELDKGDGIFRNVIRIAKENPDDLMEGFSSCDEYGVAKWLPNKEMRFWIVDEETEWMFQGETYRDNDGDLVAIVKDNGGI